MNPCVFTICAKNYIGLAKVLEKSFRRYNPTSDFYIFIADVPDEDTPVLEDHIIVAEEVLDISNEEWIKQSFKYNLTEFCTAIKPYCFKWLFDEKGYTKSVYLDPDIFCFSDFKSIFNKLNHYSIILSPHILTIENKYSGDLWENLFLWAGSYNLGFLALKNDSHTEKLLNWWAGVLKDECFIDNSRFTATDQKWMTFVPMFFSQDILLIDRDMGIDAAPWNFYEREFYLKDSQIWVKNRIDDQLEPNRLIFVHYSNYKYSELAQGIVKHHDLKKEYKDIALIFDPYLDQMQCSQINDYLPLRYSYNTYENGVTISLFNRRIYRRLLLEGRLLGNPYLTGKGSFYNNLKKRGLLSKYQAVTSSVRGKKHPRNTNTLAIKMFDWVCFCLKSVLGIDRYEQFIRFASTRFLPENQVFLYNHKSLPNL